MKTIFARLILLILLSGFFLQTEAQHLTIQQTKLIENKVDSIFQVMLSHAEKLDYDALSKGVNDKYKAGFISNGNYYKDYATLIDFIKPRSQGVSNQDITLQNKKISVLTDNIVLLTASGISHVVLEDGNIFDVNFYWSFIYEKIDDEWKVVQSHQSRGK